MNEARRNTVVGLFVLTALILLGALILIFGYAPQFWAKGYTIQIHFPSAGPIQPEDPVYVNGWPVGKVQTIHPIRDPREGVIVTVFVNQGNHIPISAKPLIKEQSIGFGKPAIRIEVGREDSDKMVPEDGTGVLQGSVAQGIAEVIPKSIMDKLEHASVALTTLAEKLQPVADDLHQLMKPLPMETVDRSATQPTTRPGEQPLANISTAVQRLDLALKSFNQVLADPNNQRNIEVMLRNFREVSERGVEFTRQLNQLAENTDKRINTISTGLVQNTDKLNQLFDKLNETADKINAGQGTLGKFLNDPEFFDALTQTALRLQLAVDDFRNLLHQWEERGLKIQGGLFAK